MDCELCVETTTEDKTPSGQGNLEDPIQVTHRLRTHTLITPSSRQAINFSVPVGV